MFSLAKAELPIPQYKESTERNTISENKVDKENNLLFTFLFCNPEKSLFPLPLCIYQDTKRREFADFNNEKRAR